MAYVRSKLIRGYGPYYYLVECIRVPDKGPRQKVIRYLGRNSGGRISEPETTSNPSSAHRGLDGPEDPIKDDEGADAMARREAEWQIIKTSDAPEAQKEKATMRRRESR